MLSGMDADAAAAAQTSDVRAAARRPPLRPVARLSSVVALAAAIMFATALAGHAAQPRVILVGDSVTAGWGASDASHAWPALLELPVQVDATPRAPSGRFLGRTWNAGTVVVELGICDYARGVAPEAFADHMRQILANITADRVVLVVPYLVGREGTSPWSAYAGQLLTLARMDARVVLVDLQPAFGNPATVLLDPDLVHPNDQGHAVIAQLVARAIAG